MRRGSIVVALALGAFAANAQTNYDADGDGLIEIRNLAQLNAVRFDLDGNGVPTTMASSQGTPAQASATYNAAFPNPAGGGVCPTGTTCRGYELLNDLTFDTDGDGDVDGNDPGSYPNWLPIGRTVAPSGMLGPGEFTATFHGNGHVIDKLRMTRTSANDDTQVGLFGRARSARIEAVGLTNVDISGSSTTGGIVGALLESSLVASYSTGRVTACNEVGGLVGVIQANNRNSTRIAASWSSVNVNADGPGVGRQCANGSAGGLVGDHNDGAIVASYALGRVTSGDGNGGGLTGNVPGSVLWVGNLVDSYWNASSTTQTVSYTTSAPVDGGTGNIGTRIATTTGALTASAMQTPTGYVGIYANWNIDLDGDSVVDDPWHFGTSSQYPSIKWGGFGVSQDGVPTEVRAEARAQGLLVTWQAVAGATSYRVQWRVPGQAWSSSRQAETTETRYEIAGLSDGAYEVRVLAVIDGVVGEPSAAAQGEVGTPGNRPPRALGLADVALDVEETATVDLDAAFEDPDGDALRYAVAVDGDAVEARVSGATLRLRGALAGEATVTVTATDPDDQSASTSFTAQVGAVLSLHGSPAAPEGGMVALQAELSRPLATDVELGWRMAMDDDPTTADADAADFGAWAGTMTFAAGETRAQIAVAVLDDDAIEPARERFAMELEQPEDGNVGLSARAWRVLGSVQEGVCDRTPEVRAELSQNWRACHWPRPSDLSARTTLNLRGHGASALRSDDLLGLSRLRTLDLGRNALQELPTGLLRHTPQLRSLRLDGNRLQSLPAGLFADIAGLRELRLAGNPGAPFALAPTLQRTDAEPWAAGPATVEAALPLGAPFALHLALSVVGGEASAETLAFAAGKSASDAVQVSGDGPALVSLAAPTIPQTRCGNAPCFDGLAAQGATLALFVPPPRISMEVPTADLLSGGDTRIDLSAHFAASATGGALSYTATLDDPRLATVSVTGALLTVTANEDGEEGTVTVTVVATDDFGQTATLRFEVEISPRPSTRWRGWRSTVAAPAAEQAPAAGDAGG